jgi:hypothetical protein
LRLLRPARLRATKRRDVRGRRQQIGAPEFTFRMNRAHPWIIFAPHLIVGAATPEGLWLEYRQGKYDWRAYFTSLGDMALRTAVYLVPLSLASGALNWLWNHRFYSLPLASVRATAACG